MQLVRPITVTDAVLTSSNVTDPDQPAWSAATTYALGQRVSVTAANYHKVFESAQAGNTNHNPTTDNGTWWTEVGATNRWAMFDGIIQSQTTRADSIAVILAVPGRIDTVALLNVSALSAHITLTAAAVGVVYDHTASLVSPSGITDWYAYFFEPIARLADIVFTGLPPYANATLSVTLSAAGETVACGALVAGFSKTLGDLQFSPKLGITDYSVKQADEFGNFTILERAYAKRSDFSVIVQNTFVDELITLLAGYRATPVLYIGNTDYTSTAVYGFYRDFQVEIAYPDVSFCTLELEGLT
jgi:hypothetical protein